MQWHAQGNDIEERDEERAYGHRPKQPEARTGMHDDPQRNFSISQHVLVDIPGSQYLNGPHDARNQKQRERDDRGP
jgi:hypothetical protein